MKSLLFTFAIPLSFVCFGQNTPSPIDDFAKRQDACEQKFISFLKSNKIDSCLNLLSYTIHNRYGHDSLKVDLEKINKLFAIDPSPAYEPTLSESAKGVGAFGHDTNGKLEKQATYKFMDKDSVVYFFSLYYSDREPISVIRFYESTALNDFKKYDRIKVKIKMPGE